MSAKVVLKTVDNPKHNWISHLVINDPAAYFNLLDGLFEERYTIGQVGINKQDFQFWRNNKLVDTITESPTLKREWIKVSFFTLFWLKIVNELRRLGVPVSTILEIKKFFYTLDEEIIDQIIQGISSDPQYEQLIQHAGKEVFYEWLKNTDGVKKLLQEKLNLLILLSLSLLDTNAPTYLIIEPGKEPEILMLNEDVVSNIDYRKTFIRNTSYYCIYLNPLIADYFNSDKIKAEEFQETFKLSKAQKQIFAHLRKEGIKNLRVKFNSQSKKMDLLLELQESANQAKFKDLLLIMLEKGNFKKAMVSDEGDNLVITEIIHG